MISNGEGGGMDLRSELSAMPAGVVPSPWNGFEHVRGWGVFGAPFSSGHVLALRVSPQNDFAPYRTPWHRAREGEWTIYYDGLRADTACPRYYGAASRMSRESRLDLTWTGPMSLRVEMDQPQRHPSHRGHPSIGARGAGDRARLLRDHRSGRVLAHESRARDRRLRVIAPTVVGMTIRMPGRVENPDAILRW